LAHLEGELSDFGVATVLWHVNDFQEYVLASIFPLEGNVFVYNIEF